MAQEEFTPQPLFGGAAVIHLPPRFVDTSRFRQVPDTQEVWADAATDQSVMVDLLECVEGAAEQAAQIHFNILAEHNEAARAEIKEVVPAVTRADSILSIVHGSQEVAKFNEKATNVVGVHVACLRLPRFNTDIVISLNSPEWIAAASSSAAAVDHQMSPQHNPEVVAALFSRLVESFQLLDTSLLVPS